MTVGSILNLLNKLNKSILCKHNIILFNKLNKVSNKPTRGYPKMCGLFKYLLNVNVYCNEILSVYILEYYEQILKTTV